MTTVKDLAKTFGWKDEPKDKDSKPKEPKPKDSDSKEAESK